MFSAYKHYIANNLQQACVIKILNYTSYHENNYYGNYIKLAVTFSQTSYSFLFSRFSVQVSSHEFIAPQQIIHTCLNGICKPEASNRKLNFDGGSLKLGKNNSV